MRSNEPKHDIPVARRNSNIISLLDISDKNKTTVLLTITINAEENTTIRDYFIHIRTSNSSR